MIRCRLQKHQQASTKIAAGRSMLPIERASSPVVASVAVAIHRSRRLSRRTPTAHPRASPPERSAPGLHEAEAAGPVELDAATTALVDRFVHTYICPPRFALVGFSGGSLRAPPLRSALGLSSLSPREHARSPVASTICTKAGKLPTTLVKPCTRILSTRDRRRRAVGANVMAYT